MTRCPKTVNSPFPSTGSRFRAIKVSQLSQDDNQGGYVTSDPKIVQPVLAAARVGEDAIMVTYDGPETQEVATADLTGIPPEPRLAGRPAAASRFLIRLYSAQTCPTSRREPFAM